MAVAWMNVECRVCGTTCGGCSSFSPTCLRCESLSIEIDRIDLCKALADIEIFNDRMDRAIAFAAKWFARVARKLY